MISPDGSDFAVAMQRKYKFGVVVCHNGDVFVYSAKRHISQLFLDQEIEKTRAKLYNSTEEKVISEVISRLKECDLTCLYLKPERNRRFCRLGFCATAKN